MRMATRPLAGYRLAVHFCSAVLQHAPDNAFLALAHEQALFAGWPAPLASEEGASALDALIRLFRSGPGNRGAISQDCLRIFSGPAPLARPWESVWRERDGVLFGEATMRVRQVYAQWGLVSEARGREPEDHLGLELAFCVHLLRGISGGNKAAAAALLAFLDEHPLQWAEPCLRTAAENAADGFYRAVPLLCLDVLRGLRQALDPAQTAP